MTGAEASALARRIHDCTGGMTVVREHAATRQFYVSVHHRGPGVSLGAEAQRFYEPEEFESIWRIIGGTVAGGQRA